MKRRSLGVVCSVTVLAGSLFVFQNAARAAVGDISTIAGDGNPGSSGDGGLAVSAELNGPHGLAVDSAGNIFIADAGNARIRKIDPSGTITTVAGNATAGYSGDGGPATSASIGAVGVAVDPSGNLYIADLAARIRRVDAGTGIITTVAGTGVQGLSGDGGPASSAEISRASRVLPIPGGGFLISDYDNGRIRKVDVNGIITTIAGTSNGATAGDGGPALSAVIDTPGGLALDVAGNLYIAQTDSSCGDVDNSRVRKIDASTGVISTFAGGGGSCGSFSGDGGPAMGAELNNPFDLAVDGLGALLISDYGNNRIRRVDTSGVIATVAGNGSPDFSGDGGPATSAAINGPLGIGFTPAGDLVIATNTDNRARKVENIFSNVPPTTTTTTTTATLPPGADVAVSVVDAPDPVKVRGNVFYTVSVSNGGADVANEVTLAINVTGGVVQSATPSPTGASCVTGKGKDKSLTCTLGAVVSRGSPTVTVVVQAPNKPGTMSLTASASSKTPDSNPSNNSASQATTVVS